MASRSTNTASLDLESSLWEATNRLRGNMDSAVSCVRDRVAFWGFDQTTLWGSG